MIENFKEELGAETEADIALLLSADDVANMPPCVIAALGYVKMIYNNELFNA